MCLSRQAFHEHYYSTFDSNRAALAGLYQENAILSFEGQKFQGQAAVMQKLTSLPFQQVTPYWGPATWHLPRKGMHAL